MKLMLAPRPRSWTPPLALRSDFGPRGDRQKTRLIYCIEAMGGIAPFTAQVEACMGLAPGALRPAVHATYDAPWDRRDLLGVHPQKQEGLCWVGASVPAGRITQGVCGGSVSCRLEGG